MEDSGVSASCVHPGGIKTNIAKTARMNESMAKVTGQAADKARQQFNDQLLRTTRRRPPRSSCAACSATAGAS